MTTPQRHLEDRRGTSRPARWLIPTLVVAAIVVVVVLLLVYTGGGGSGSGGGY